MAGGSCRVIALRSEQARPQLISTSRHVTQGLVDVSELKWDATSRTMHGRSKVVAGDDYELRFDAPGTGAIFPSIAEPDRVAGASWGALKQSGRQLRITIQSSVTREVSWEIRFTSEGADKRAP